MGSDAEPAGTEAEVQCPGCGATIRSRLGDQVVIAELRAQGWRPPDELDADLPGGDVCRPEVVAVGSEEQVVVVHGQEPMTERDREVLADVVAAVQRRVLATDEHLGVRQELAMAWMKAAARVPDCPEKDRLRAAVRAAQQALSPDRNGDGGTHV